MTSVTISAEQLEWYNRGIVLLIAIMRGRADHGAAERKIYEDWRQQGNLLDVSEQEA